MAIGKVVTRVPSEESSTATILVSAATTEESSHNLYEKRGICITKKYVIKKLSSKGNNTPVYWIERSFARR